ncbi:MAG: hypothetical protein ACM3ZT_01530 [Bacillota bacterium]
MRALPTSPQSPAEIIGSGFELGIGIYAKLFMATSLIAFLQLLPIMDLALRLGNTEVTPEAQLSEQFSGHQIMVQLAVLFMALLVQGMAIARLDHLAQGQPGDYRDEWHRGLKAFLPLVGALLLSIAIGVAGGLLASVVGLLIGFLGSLVFGKAGFMFFFVATLFVTILYICVYLLFIQYCIVLEGRGPIEAVNSSFRLVYGRWWRPFTVLLLLLLVFIVAAILLMIVVVPVALALHGPQTGRSLFIQGVIQMVATAVVTPLILAIFYTLYRDLKLRASGA